MSVVVMGVSGAGKTAVGKRLAERLDWPFVDADDLHSGSNVQKMAAGVPLTDEDRLPWLRAVRRVLVEHARAGRPAVIACSALKAEYRELLFERLADVLLVYLRATPDVLERRLAERRDHFFDPTLLASQLETLEEPGEALVVDADNELEAVLEAVLEVVLEAVMAGLRHPEARVPRRPSGRGSPARSVARGGGTSKKEGKQQDHAEAGETDQRLHDGPHA